jgi:hypothetical protein
MIAVMGSWRRKREHQLHPLPAERMRVLLRPVPRGGEPPRRLQGSRRPRVLLSRACKCGSRCSTQRNRDGSAQLTTAVRDCRSSHTHGRQTLPCLCGGAFCTRNGPSLRLSRFVRYRGCWRPLTGKEDPGVGAERRRGPFAAVRGWGAGKLPLR